LPNSIVVKFILIVYTGFSSLGAQSPQKSDFGLHLDYARFHGEQNLTMVEVYYSFSRDSIEHLSTGKQYVATYRSKLDISVKDSVLKTIEWNSQDVLNSLEDLKPNQMINDVYGLLLGKGNFKIQLELKDLSSGKIGFDEIRFQVDPQQTDSLSISDIQVGLSISRSKMQNRFVKNGVSIIPNPSNIFSLQQPVLYYYCEIYNLKNPVSSIQGKYNFIASIKDINGKIIKKIPAKSKNIHNPSVVEIDKTLVSSLKSGVYELVIEVVNLVTDERVMKNKQFYVYRPADYVQRESDKPQKKEDLYLVFLTKSEEELDQEFEYTTFMTSSDEEDMYEELDLEGKRKFLTGFWGLKNMSPEKSTQAFRQDYLDLVILATERYSYSGTEGWKTARGRVLLLYGLPDDIEKHYGGPVTKQYETWTYHGLEGGSYFVFLDISGYGNYQLVHSTVSTEINDVNWEENYLR
jgi:GWxTD domain-containing protein